jgi:hypothetical protein
LLEVLTCVQHNPQHVQRTLKLIEQYSEDMFDTMRYPAMLIKLQLSSESSLNHDVAICFHTLSHKRFKLYVSES